MCASFIKSRTLANDESTFQNHLLACVFMANKLILHHKPCTESETNECFKLFKNGRILKNYLTMSTVMQVQDSQVIVTHSSFFRNDVKSSQVGFEGSNLMLELRTKGRKLTKTVVQRL